jgi:Phage integrase family
VRGAGTGRGSGSGVVGGSAGVRFAGAAGVGEASLAFVGASWPPCVGTASTSTSEPSGYGRHRLRSGASWSSDRPRPRLASEPLHSRRSSCRRCDTYAEPGRLGLVFVGERGGPLRRCNFSDRWASALEAVGLTDVHFHDLRHSGNTWAASTGASFRELMRPMGHASSDAALRYQHATSDRDRAVADALDRLADEQDDDERKRRVVLGVSRLLEGGHARGTAGRPCSSC